MTNTAAVAYDKSVYPHLLIADGGARDIAQLLQGATVPSRVIAAGSNPLEEITRALGGHRHDVLHLVGHGRYGAILIGGEWIDAAALMDHCNLIWQWQVRSIALWGCGIGNDSPLVRTLSQLTGAFVYASNHPLGMTTDGPHWQLSGGFPADLIPFAPQVLQQWPHQLAGFSFSNAYRVTSTADKESNSLTFDFSLPLGKASIDDGTGSANFSGNDVSATAINIGGQNYYGWISRPIKVGGKIVGFYMWTDEDFTSLASAQVDGNADGDSADAPSDPGTADNTGFILVVDQAYFNNLAVSSGVSTKSVNSSSDRVDSALNSLLPTSTAPTAVADTSNLGLSAGASGGPALEQGSGTTVVTTVNAIGNVLSNDIDLDSGDTLTVSNVGIASATTAVTASTTSATGTSVTGTYGTLTLGSDGSYKYVVNNSNTAVEALRTTSNTLSDVFTYTMKDAAGAKSTTSLTVKIQGANDAPAAVNDFNSAKESIEALAANQYGAADATGATATGNVLSNDRIANAGFLRRLSVLCERG